MELALSPELLIAFTTLLVLEIVLGIDNVVFISILAAKLPPEQQNRARVIGLMLAMFMRIALIFTATWIIGLTADIFALFGIGFSGRDIILILGGLFLVYETVVEIHEKLEGEQGHARTGKAVTFGAIMVQILLIDIVFSFDSVITAVGMVDELWVMIAAVVISIVLMLFIAKAIGVEVLNLLYRRSRAKRRNTTTQPVELRPTLVEDPRPARITPVPVGAERRALAAFDTMNEPEGAP